MNFEGYNRLNKYITSELGIVHTLKAQSDSLSIEIKTAESYLESLVMARKILSEASRLTQEQVKNRIENLVTLALKSVWPDRDYKFIVNVEIKRNKSEVELLVQEGDKEPYIPKEDQGGGILDIISFALRIVLWAMEKPRSRNVFILDEPMKWTGVLAVRAGEMIKEISKKLGIQIIMVTHDIELAEIADKAWKVDFKDGKSIVTNLGEEAEQTPQKILRRRKK